VSPFAKEIRHEDPELAIEFAFYVFTASILRKMHGYASESVFEHVDWDVMKREATTLLMRYLCGGEA
jgi:hypothetical protein